MITPQEKEDVSKSFRKHENDSGSTAVQVAILTAQINDLAKHTAENKKDHSSRLGLLKMVGQRRRLLNYLSKTDEAQYKHVLSELKLRK